MTLTEDVKALREYLEGIPGVKSVVVFGTGNGSRVTITSNTGKMITISIDPFRNGYSVSLVSEGQFFDLEIPSYMITDNDILKPEFMDKQELMSFLSSVAFNESLEVKDGKLKYKPKKHKVKGEHSFHNVLKNKAAHTAIAEFKRRMSTKRSEQFK